MIVPIDRPNITNSLSTLQIRSTGEKHSLHVPRTPNFLQAVLSMRYIARDIVNRCTISETLKLAMDEILAVLEVKQPRSIGVFMSRSKNIFV